MTAERSRGKRLWKVKPPPPNEGKLTATRASALAFSLPTAACPGGHKAIITVATLASGDSLPHKAGVYAINQSDGANPRASGDSRKRLWKVKPPPK